MNRLFNTNEEFKNVKNSFQQSIEYPNEIPSSPGVNEPQIESRVSFASDTLNKIYFGPPGTGKSHQLNLELKKHKIGLSQVELITFHPEFDFQSFVGAYKPVSNGENISYKFVAQAFTKIYVDAWNNPSKHYVLRIEEINRGNCAEIFGDIFQLLDRNKAYSVTASNELSAYLTKSLNTLGLEGIESGKLHLPSNLAIWATMNTSDQSLFPMDSAFKRRWEWQYVPINYQCKQSNFIINLGFAKYPWLEFLKAINTEIRRYTESEDKQLGNWFIQAESDKNLATYQQISERQFLNKAIFYLWNDVFKGETDELFSYPYEDDNIISYSDFFDHTISHKILQHFMEQRLNLKALEN